MPVSAAALDWPGHEAAVRYALEDAATPDERADEVRRAERLDPESAASVLGLALQDGSVAVRVAALETIGAMRLVSLESEVIGRLSDRSADVRAAAARAIGVMEGVQHVGALSRLLVDRDDAVRAAAVVSLGQLGSGEAGVTLSEALHDRARGVVVVAIEALASLGQRNAVYAILDKTSDPAEEVVLAAIDALVAMHALEAIPALLERVGDARESVSIAAIEALGELGSPEAVSALTEQVLSPRTAAARLAAVEALLAIADPRVLDALQPLLSSDPETVAALYTAAKPVSWPYLERAFAQAGSDQQSSVLRVWLMSDDPAAVIALERLPAGEDTHAMLRLSNTELAFCTALDDAVIDTLSADDVLDWVSWGVRSGAPACLTQVIDGFAWQPVDAWQALALVGDRSIPMSETLLLEHATPEEATWELTGPLISAWAERPDAVPLLQALLGAREERVRRDVAFALTELGGTAAFPALRPYVLDDELRRPGFIRLATDSDAETVSVLRRLSVDGTAPERVEALHALTEECALSEASAMAAISHHDLWVRRAGAVYAARCDLPVTSDSTDPELRRATWRDWDTVEAIARDHAERAYVRLAALQWLMATDWDASVAVAEAFEGARDARLRAVAWLLLPQGANALDVRSRAFVMRHPLERAAAFASLQDAAADWRPLSIRRETDPNVLRVLQQDAVYEAPVTVFAFDDTAGGPVRDTWVFALRNGRRFAVARTDAEGRVVFPHDDVVAVFVGQDL